MLVIFSCMTWNERVLKNFDKLTQLSSFNRFEKVAREISTEHWRWCHYKSFFSTISPAHSRRPSTLGQMTFNVILSSNFSRFSRRSLLPFSHSLYMHALCNFHLQACLPHEYSGAFTKVKNRTMRMDFMFFCVHDTASSIQRLYHTYWTILFLQ